MSENSNKEQWGSRVGYIMAALGMCIGTGNIWRFPRVAAKNGGGAFIIAWTIALFVWSIPLLMTEMSMGKKARLGTIGGFRDFVGKKYTWMGTFICIVCLMLMSYYSVVMGYCVKYFTLGITGQITSNMTTDQTTLLWNTFLSTKSETLIFHLLSIGIGCFVVYKGISTGIEKFCKVVIPAVFVILIVTAVYSLTLPGASLGLEYLFNPNLSKLSDPKVWLEAFTQSAWSTGAGWGFIITYSVYTRKEEDITNNCFIMGLGDNLGALLPALIVLPTIFALSPSVEVANQAVSAGNYGMTFIYLVQVFSVMPLGKIIAPLFFLLMAIAALTSLFSMIEVGVRNLLDLKIGNMNRKKATLIICGTGFLIGLPSALTINFLNNQDWVWGVGLLVSGLFFSIAAIKYGAERIRNEVINIPTADFKAGKWYTVFITMFPVMFVLLCGWWLWQTTQWYPGEWWKPFEVESAGTIAFQWGLAIIVCLATKNFFNKNISNGPMTHKASNKN